MVHGITFDLDLSEAIDVAVYLEGYEKDVRAAIDRHCQRGAIVIDVGANIGAHALYLAKKVGETGRVFAFEPADYAFAKLEKNIALNQLPNLEALKLALSEDNAEARPVALRSSWRTDGTRLKETAVVPFARLDDWCSGRGVTRVDLIKLDVDGHEFAILKGGANLLETNHPTIILEVGAWHFDKDATNPLLYLSTLGYTFENAATAAKYSNISNIRGQLPPHDPEMTVSINVVALAASQTKTEI